MSSHMSAQVVDHNMYYAISFGSFLVCIFVHVVVCPIVSRRKWKQYRELNWKLQWEWNSRLVSSMHASAVSVLSLFALLTESALWNDNIWGRGTVAKIALGCSIGYMAADSLLMPIYWKGKELHIYWLHHGMSGLTFYFAITFEVCQFFAMFRLVSEFSTPFGNQRWFFDKLGYYKTSGRVVLNGLSFSLSFLVVRVLPIPIYWFSVSRVFRAGVLRLMLSTHPFTLLLWFSTSLLLDVLNVYWSRKVIKGGTKLVKTFAMHHWTRRRRRRQRWTSVE